MSDTNLKTNEFSKEMVALYLSAMTATSQGALVNIRNGIPYIEGGMTSKQILQNYADALNTVRLSSTSDLRDYIAHFVP